MAMLVPEVPIDRSTRRIWWAYIPAALVLGLICYVVPYGFIEMRVIHGGLVAEFEGIDGFETLETDVQWYPWDTGGSLTLKPLGEGGVNDVKERAGQLGYGGGFVASGGWTTRDRTDAYDADLFRVVESPDDTIRVDVSVFDTDLLVSWPLPLIVGGVAFLILLTAGRSLEIAVRRPRSPTGD